jgi:uncharacterized GH25 family protein
MHFILRRVQSNRMRLLASALWLAATPALAHDFWIEPANFAPNAGDKVPLKLFVGQHFTGNSVLYLPEHFERYSAFGADGAEQPVAGNRGDDPAGTMVAGAGVNIVGFHSKKFEVSFDSLPEFEKYLADEGLERNLALAGKRWKLRSGILEVYSRCAKSFIKVGNPSGAWSDHVFGFPLELIATSSPYAAARKLQVQLLYRGKPLEAALVVAFNKHSPHEKVKVRTDQDGRATLPLARDGVWLVTSVHMIPAPLLSRADWESFWASLTFELR